MAIKVIGAGFGRTGTMSLKMALEQLEFGKCYHMFELFDHTEGVPYWRKAMNGEKVDWDSLFKGYQSIVDFPGCLYVKELMEAYPDAKVVLSVRDPEAWWKVSATILDAEPPLPTKIRMGFRYPFVKRVRDVFTVIFYNIKDIYKGTFEGKPMDKDTAIRVFNSHNEAMKKLVPKERLLVYEVKEGWGPLCEFLNVEVPEADFPESIPESSSKKLFGVFTELDPIAGR